MYVRLVSPEEIEALFREETSHVEWKESHDAKDLLDAVCAFANDLADSKREGHVVIGVRSKTGAPTGKYPRAGTNTDEVQQKLASLLNSTKIIPHPAVDIETLARGDDVVFLLRVQPYAVPPVVKVNGTCYVRIGTVTQRANEAHLRRLEERRPVHLQPFDIRPCEGASLDDLDRHPGAPFGQAALGKFGEHSEYRNPRITQLLLEEGYVERAGRGVRRAQALLAREGHPPLEVETNGHTTVTLRRRVG